MSNSTTIPTENLSDLFGWPEYLVFSVMLLISAGIGIMYGCFGQKQKTTKEFLMAGRSMGTFPVAMSLIASFMSAITLLGTPAEVYTKGSLYWMIGPSYLVVMASAAYLYLPVFFNLQVTSAYEYLELRFAKPVRMLGSAIFTLQMTIYMAIVVYAPALALSQVTGLNVYGCVTAIFTIVIFYTALGGMKAVMWTDVFQTIIMFVAMLAVVIKGTIDLGGHSAVWEISDRGGRIEFFNFDFDPRTRHTVWGLLFGGYFTWLAIYGVNQAQVQRYLTVPTMRQAQNAIWINFVGLFGLLSICCWGGLVIYGKYALCDPLTSQRVKTPDQLFPLFVMDTLSSFRGLPGLFVAGIFSGALRFFRPYFGCPYSVRPVFDRLPITLEDFVKHFYPEIRDETATKVSKILAVMYGLISFGLVFVAEQLGGVLQAALSIFGIIGGPLLGVFTLGMFLPWANSKGAFAGTITALAFMLWLGIGANMAIGRKDIITPKLSVSTEECTHGNFSVSPTIYGNSGGILEFYRISYMWYSMIGCTITILIGLLVSFLTGKNDPRTLNPNLISPPIDKLVRRFVPEHIREAVLWDLGAHIKTDIKSTENGHRNSHLAMKTNGNGNADYNSGMDNPSFRYDDNENRGESKL